MRSNNISQPGELHRARMDIACLPIWKYKSLPCDGEYRLPLLEYSPAFNMYQKADWGLGRATPTTPTPLVLSPRWGQGLDGQISLRHRWWGRRGQRRGWNPHPCHQRWQRGLDGGMGEVDGICCVIGISGDTPVISAPRFYVRWSRLQGERFKQPNTHHRGPPSCILRGD